MNLVKGWFSNTLNERTRKVLRLEKADLIMIDCDIYSASKEALKFSLPLIKDQAIVIFDDWGTEDGLRIGQKEAFEATLGKSSHFDQTPMLPTGKDPGLFMSGRKANPDGYKK
ncbi:MAG TPA: TylF/MycF/NovP-related O-methyltransferase [Cyclobacteriaceae bacterium]|nr:TylF/MycF/NovP-related O-methyltransferase [Cyclobacteriaceae bacterium]